MTFLNPLVLLGLIAAAIPLLLHLLNLRKLKTIDFSTLRFIKELQKTQIRKLKLQQILLLILRTLIVVFAVLAFSRPVIKSSIPVFGGHVKTSVVIIFDNSFSMDASDEGGNRLKQARSAALQITSALKDGDEIALITSEDVGSLRKISFTRNFSLLNENLQKLGTASRSAEVSGMLRMTAALMTESQNLNREVYVITDAQRNIFEEQVDSLRLDLDQSVVYLVPIGIGSKASGQNLSVDSLNVVTRIFQRDKPVEVEAYIRNASETDAKGVVVGMSYNGNRVAQRTLEVPAGQVRSIILAASPQFSGAIRASVDIEGDALEADNKRYFAFVIPSPPSVAVVGSPEATRFISAVLQSEASRGLIKLSVLSTAQFASANIDDFELVLLTGIASASDQPRIVKFVRNGGAVLLFANDDAQATRSLMRDLGFGEAVDARFVPAQPATFTSTDKLHPIFQGVFKGTTDSKAIVETAKIVRALPSTGGQYVITMQGGAFLSESRIGDGRAMYCAVAPNLGWSNFPITGLFPTIIFRSIPYLTAREQLGTSSISGKTLTLSLPKRFSRGGTFKVTDASNVESLREAASLPSGAVLGLGMMNQVGVTIVRTQNNQDVTTVAVNLPSSESLLHSFTASECRSEFARRLKDGTPFELLDARHNIAESVARARLGTELWKLFVVLAILSALAEMIVARYAGKVAVTT